MKLEPADLKRYVETEPPNPDYVFLSLLAGTVEAITGPGGNGKTILTKELAVAVATGCDITGGA